MTFDQTVQYLSWAIYALIFCVVTAKAVRRPRTANIDIALFFAVPALVIAITVAQSLGIVSTQGLPNTISSSLIVIMGYMLFRLVDDFSEVPVWLSRAALAGLALCVLGLIVYAPPRPAWLSVVQIAYLVGVISYTIPAVVRESQHVSGVTMRRMRAVALASFSLCLLFLVALVPLFVPRWSEAVRPFIDLIALASAIGYFLGFATPGILRRAWQEPELRAFLGRAASLPSLPDTATIIRQLERGAASSVGAPDARIGLWDDGSKRLKFQMDDREIEIDPSQSISGRAFYSQQAVFTENVRRDSPSYGPLQKIYGGVAVLVAPITAGEKRLGVLSVYASRAPIFAEEDLALVQLLADQAAVILESRALIDEAARVQAREEITRLKEDFLSAAAHDLKTPLTTLVMQAELLERRAMRAPDAPADLASLQRLKNESYRLKSLVLELLDAARAEQGRLVGERVPTDLAAYAAEVCERHSTALHPCSVEVTGDGKPIGQYDPNRILQLIENLVENAVKYSPGGGPVTVRVSREKRTTEAMRGGNDGKEDAREEWNHLAVTDSGIGIPREDLPNVFERFHRGSNVDDRRFAGMGLGLFICKGIVEQHGGRIWVESGTSTAGSSLLSDHATVGGAIISRNGSNDHDPSGTKEMNAHEPNNDNRGTTFHVLLPALPAGRVGATSTESAQDNKTGR
jgi:signal transduction histidine kinase